jgi:hypothetical protein
MLLQLLSINLEERRKLIKRIRSSLCASYRQVVELSGQLCQLINRQLVTAHRAITIDRPPEEVWPWIAQFGGGAAYYS